MAVRKGWRSERWRAEVGPAAWPADGGTAGGTAGRLGARADGARADIARADAARANGPGADAARAAAARTNDASVRAGAGSAGCGASAGASAGASSGGKLGGSPGWSAESKPSSATRGNGADARRCRERGAAGEGWTFSTDSTVRRGHKLRIGCTTAPSTPPVRKTRPPTSATRRERCRHNDFLRNVWRIRPFSLGTDSAGDRIALRTRCAALAGSSRGSRSRIRVGSRVGSEGNRFTAPPRWSDTRTAWLVPGAIGPKLSRR